jgi:hypothetical protein
MKLQNVITPKHKGRPALLGIQFSSVQLYLADGGKRERVSFSIFFHLFLLETKNNHLNNNRIKLHKTSDQGQNRNNLFVFF